jgi:hypothetical protein
MTHVTGADLIKLLPAVYQVRDADNAGVLAQLADVLAGQVRVLQAELDQFYDDQFIETCADWVTAYIGDLVGYRPLTGPTPAVSAPRADVAHTIRSRRRKGTATMLEQVARDVTGWPARAVELFERVAWSQYENHVRLDATLTPDLRDHEALNFIGGGFDDVTRTADVRSITTAAGSGPTTAAVGGPGAIRPNIPNVGVFLWRTAAIPIIEVPAVAAANDRRRFRFDSLGRDRTVYSMAVSTDQVTELAEPQNTPMPLGRRWLADHLDDHYGVGSSLVVQLRTGTTTTPYDAQNVRVSDLSDLGAGWAHQPPSGSIAIDPVLGRIYLGDALPSSSNLIVSYYYGEAVPCGASGRPRDLDQDLDLDALPTVDRTEVNEGGDVSAALGPLAATGGAVVITDSWTYDAPDTISAADGQTVRLVAATSCEPLIVATDTVSLDLGTDATVVLDGLLISGGSVVINEYADNSTRTLSMQDCTLVPGISVDSTGAPTNAGAASLVILHPYASVTLTRCIVGPIIAVQGATVTLIDCVLDATAPDAVAYCGRVLPAAPALLSVQSAADLLIGDGLTAGAALTVTTSTCFGGIHAEILEVSDSLLVADSPGPVSWPAPVWAHERQQSCIRFSYLPTDSRVGRRFECQPDGTADIVPTFTSVHFGDPAYCQLDVITPPEIRRGADDESEMGATHALFIPALETNLCIRLNEYLRFGLSAGFIYAS